KSLFLFSMQDIIIGRLEKDRLKYGKRGTIFIGKQYIHMGQTTSLTNTINLDVASSHVIFICGKRGSGKSYTMGVIAEGVSDLPEDVKQNVSIILLDTMGVYWTMKYPNKEDELLLKEWKMKSKFLPIKIYTPTAFYKEFRDKGIPTDYPFAIKTSDLNAEDWCLTFEQDINSPLGVLIEQTILETKKQNKLFDIDDIISALKKDSESDPVVKNAAINRFKNAKEWGIFSKEGTEMNELAAGGQVTVLDMSPYATMERGWKIKSLVVGLISKKLFNQRMIARKEEEQQSVTESMHYFTEEKKRKLDRPLVWLVIDEAHEFLPRDGKTAASDSLITILREGRQPGISLILASQQPGKIHTDVMTQADTVISHRITAKMDVEALGLLMQSYMRQGLDKELDALPREKGSALIFDDSNERLYQVKIRPRFTWHGGGSPNALKDEE
ncbi:MAG TPA: ATP-binding protein, partial [bacterium]|nr:ATP-binding protein [bacterium]